MIILSQELLGFCHQWHHDPGPTSHFGMHMVHRYQSTGYPRTVTRVRNLQWRIGHLEAVGEGECDTHKLLQRYPGTCVSTKRVLFVPETEKGQKVFANKRYPGTRVVLLLVHRAPGH
jgi:hypothetical protein